MFSNDVIFNENMPAHLGVPRPIPSSIMDTSTSSSARPLCDHPRVRTNAGKAYDTVMELKQFQCDERQRKVLKNAAANGGVSHVDMSGVDVSDTAFYGGADVMNLVDIVPGFAGGVPDLSPSMEAIESLVSFLDSSSLFRQVDIESLSEIETDLIHSFFSISDPFVFFFSSLF